MWVINDTEGYQPTDKIGIRNTTLQYEPVLIFLRGGRVADLSG